MRYSTRRELDNLKTEIALNDRQRQIFEMRYEQGKPIAVIADLLGFSPRTVDYELSVIRRKIQKIL